MKKWIISFASLSLVVTLLAVSPVITHAKDVTPNSKHVGPNSKHVGPN